jgi:L-cystine uptake protein TcyP (sodium:dicarboxylate symporter family)
MKKIKSFFKFKVFVFPKILQIIFIPLIILSLASIVIIFKQDVNVEKSVYIILFSPLLILAIRSLFELFIVPFKQYEVLQDIHSSLQKNESSK